MVDTVGLGLSGSTTSRPIVSTSTRWNLKDDTIYPQWHRDLCRILRHATSSTFLLSSRPALDTIIERQSAARMTRQAPTTSLAQAQQILEEWDAHNAKVYDIVDASVTLTEAQMLEVEAKFGDGGRGLEYLDWVRAHSNSDKQSAQLRYQKSLDELMIAPTATAAEINTVFEIIETV